MKKFRITIAQTVPMYRTVEIEAENALAAAEQLRAAAADFGDDISLNPWDCSQFEGEASDAESPRIYSITDAAGQYVSDETIELTSSGSGWHVMGAAFFASDVERAIELTAMDRAKGDAA